MQKGGQVFWPVRSYSHLSIQWVATISNCNRRLYFSYFNFCYGRSVCLNPTKHYQQKISFFHLVQDRLRESRLLCHYLGLDISFCHRFAKYRPKFWSKIFRCFNAISEKSGKQLFNTRKDSLVAMFQRNLVGTGIRG